MTEPPLLAACGIDCAACPALLATRAQDEPAIARIARIRSDRYGLEIRPEHVWCDGCLGASERRGAHCATCAIRVCARDRDLPNCASCLEYPCATLAALHEKVPDARHTLDALRAR